MKKLSEKGEKQVPPEFPLQGSKMDLPLHSVDFERMTTLMQTQAFPYDLSFPYQTPDVVNGQEINVNPAILENSRIMNSLELAEQLIGSGWRPKIMSDRSSR